MKRFGLIGCGISSSKSPELFAEYCGGAYPYDLIDCSTFEEAWARFAGGPYAAVNVTAPFKADACERADIKDEAVRRTGAANILRKGEGGLVEAFNSDYLGVKRLLREIPELRSVIVVGGGGAGRSAFAAAEDADLEVRLLHHGDLSSPSCAGLSSDMVIYTLPCAVPAAHLPRCRYFLEANYVSPAYSPEDKALCRATYISGLEWLEAQAVTGYPLMGV